MGNLTSDVESVRSSPGAAHYLFHYLGSDTSPEGSQEAEEQFASPPSTSTHCLLLELTNWP